MDPYQTIGFYTNYQHFFQWLHSSITLSLENHQDCVIFLQALCFGKCPRSFRFLPWNQNPIIPWEKASYNEPSISKCLLSLYARVTFSTFYMKELIEMISTLFFQTTKNKYCNINQIHDISV